MGQMTLGVFYGVEETDDRQVSALRGKWEALPAKKRGKPNLCRSHHGKVPLIGFWVAIGGDPDEAPGAVDLLGKTLHLDKVAELPSAARAHLAWERFAAWALETQDADLGAPSLWLTSVEIA